VAKRAKARERPLEIEALYRKARTLRGREQCSCLGRRERLDWGHTLGSEPDIALQERGLLCGECPVPGVGRGIPEEALLAEGLPRLVGPRAPGEADSGKFGCVGPGGAVRAHRGHRCGASA
jgi:hypothetical protein